MEALELLDDPEENGGGSLAQETAVNDNSIKAMLGEYQTVEPPPPTPQEMADEETQKVYKITDASTGKQKRVMTGNIITGAMLMLFINNILPMAVAMLHNKYAKGYKKITPDEIRLDTKSKNELKVFLDEAAKSIELKSDPVTMAMLALVSLYGMQYWGVREKIPTKQMAQEKIENKKKKDDEKS